MPEPLLIAQALLRRTGVRTVAALLLAAGLAAGGLPLLEAPGWELGQAAALAAALLAPLAGLAAARLSLSRPLPSPLAAWGAAALVLGGWIALLAGGALLRAALGPCRALGPAAGYVPLLALPSVLLGAALAVAVAFAARGRAGRAAALYALAALASLGASLWAAYRGPAAFVLDPLLGGWPGPIYDEALVPDRRALLLAVAAALEGVAVAAAAHAFVRARAGRAALALCLAATLGVLGAHRALEREGLSGSREGIARVLGGVREGVRCTVHHPAEKPAAAAAALAAECDFQAADVARALGLPPPARVVVWVYRSAEEKRRLTGAAATEYAKPWLGELHVVDAPAPHPLLRHELVHAVAAPIAGGPLGVPARLGVLVSAGLVEGLAAALETPRGRWTVHEWSRAARDLGLLPDVERLVGPAGFYAQPPARAYTAAGSFLAFLLERHGAERVREAYRTGDVAAAMGAPLPALAAQWQRFLDGIPPAPGVALAARARLGRPSLFARTCAREVAALEVRAGREAGAGRTAEACALYAEAAARGGSAGALKLAADVRARAGDLDGAAEGYRAAARAAGEEDAALRLAVAAAEGDLAWRRGELAGAVSAWTTVLATRPDRAETRLLEAKVLAAGDPDLGPAARPLLLGDGDPRPLLDRLAGMEHPLAAYLAGRALAAGGEAETALPLLERAAEGGLPDELGREAAFLVGEARCAAGQRAAGEAALRALAGPSASAAGRARAEEALRRCGAGR